MRFLSERDVRFMRQINKELLQSIIEAHVILYKLNVVESPTNIYGEAPKKAYHIGTQLTCLLNREDKNPTSDGHMIDFNQTSVFSFLRDDLKERDVYPEVGDIVEYDGSFWEINNAAENQLLGDQPFYNWAVICTCHLTKRSTLQLDPRNHLSNQEI